MGPAKALPGATRRSICAEGIYMSMTHECEAPLQTPMDSEDIARISAMLGRLRVMIGRRVIGRMALRNVAPMLDISDLDALSLVPPCPADGAKSGEEVSVGDIARQLRIDPSRASRLAAGLVQQGFLIRAVSQQDARRAVLWRSPSGEQIFAEIQRVKHEMVAGVTGDWPPERRAAFGADLERFVAGFEARFLPED